MSSIRSNRRSNFGVTCGQCGHELISPNGLSIGTSGTSIMFGVVGNATAVLRPSSTPRQRAILFSVALALSPLRVRRRPRANARSSLDRIGACRRLCPRIGLFLVSWRDRQAEGLADRSAGHVARVHAAPNQLGTGRVLGRIHHSTCAGAGQGHPASDPWWTPAAGSASRSIGPQKPPSAANSLTPCWLLFVQTGGAAWPDRKRSPSS